MTSAHDQQRPGRRLPRRWTDRVEDLAAGMLTTAALFVLLSAAVCGMRVAGDALDQSRLRDHERVEVDAQLLDDPPVPYRPSDAASITMRSVRFADPAGPGSISPTLLSAADRRPALPCGCGSTGRVRPQRRRSRRSTQRCSGWPPDSGSRV